MTDGEMRYCTLCHLHQQRKNVALGRGNEQSRFIIVGEMPGEDEDEQGQAFAGRSGRLLDSLLMQAEIPPLSTFITNTVPCVRRNPDNPKKILPPDELATKTCPWLRRHLVQRPPLVVVALGRYAIGWFKSLAWDTITNMRVRDHVNRPFKHVRDFLVVPAYHPTYVMRSGKWAALSLLHGLVLARKLYLRLC
jgi:DNA polymerase